MAQVKIIDRRKSIATGGPRVGQIETLITYTDEQQNPFLVIIPKEKVTDDEIKAAIREDMRERGDTVGKTFTV